MQSNSSGIAILPSSIPSSIPSSAEGKAAAGVVWPTAISGLAIPFGVEEVERSLCARFEKIVAQCADRVAIKAKSEQVSYGQLNRRANTIAQAIRGRVHGEPQPIALLFEQGVDAIAAIWGILKSGNTYLPLDPSYPAARNRRILDDAEPLLLLTNHSNREKALGLEWPEQRLIDISRLPDCESGFPSMTISAETPAYIIYTSGSSGEPKGVVQSHRNVLFDIRRQIQDLATTTADRYGMLFATCSSASVVHIFGAHLSGASVSPFDIRNEGLSPLADWLASEEITILDINVATFRDLCRLLPVGEGFPKLRLLAPGSEPVYKRDVELYKRHFAPTCIMQNALGTTETRTATQFYIDMQTEIETNLVPVGYPVPGKKVLILDENRREAPVGDVGEIAIRSRYLSSGYFRKPDLTAAAFLPCPEDPNARTYLTGDLGQYMRDGLLMHLGRIDSQIKIRGYRVEIAEVEMALLRLPHVCEAAVAAHDNGSGYQLVAYLVLEPGNGPSLREMRVELARVLPAHAVPSRFEFIQSLPLTLNGKLDRRALPPPSQTRTGLPPDFVHPCGQRESALASLFEDVLGFGPVGACDSFFDLGGHSLLAARLAVRVEEIFGRAMAPSAILVHPTARELASYLDRSKPDGRPCSPIPVHRAGSRPPLFCLSGIIGSAVDFIRLSHYLGENQPVYGLEAKGIDGVEPVRGSIEEVARQHVVEIKSVQARGPYYLCGFSAGGVVAYEIAQCLLAANEEIGLLGMVDTYYPQGNLPLSVTSLRAHGVKGALKQSTRRLKYSLYKRYAHLMSRKFRLKYQGGANQYAATVYRPRPYPGQLSYFRALNNRMSGTDIPHAEQWSSMAKFADIYDLPGDHYLLGEPYVRDFAAAVEGCLRKSSPM